MFFRDISFDYIYFGRNTSGTFLADQNFAVFLCVLPVFSICHNGESLSQNLELAILNNRIFK